MTINQLRTERLAYFRELKRAIRQVDTAQEKLERYAERVIERKKNIPDMGDFQTMNNDFEELGQAVSQLGRSLEGGMGLFFEG